MLELLGAMVAQSDLTKQNFNPLAQERFGDPVQTPIDIEQFRASEPVVEAEVLGEEADLGAGLDISGGLVKYLGLPAGGCHQSQKHFHGGAFPRSVGAQKPKDLAALDLHR